MANVATQNVPNGLKIDLVVKVGTLRKLETQWGKDLSKIDLNMDKFRDLFVALGVQCDSSQAEDALKASADDMEVAAFMELMTGVVTKTFGTQKNPTEPEPLVEAAAGN